MKRELGFGGGVAPEKIEKGTAMPVIKTDTRLWMAKLNSKKSKYER